MFELLNDLDLSLLVAIQGTRNAFFDAVMSAVSFLGNGGLIFIVLTVVLLIVQKTRRCGVCAASALVLDALLCNVILKPLIARPRPFDLYNVFLRSDILIALPNDFSFPSGHTAAAFAFSTAIFCENKKCGAAAYAFSVLMGCSRLYLAVHYPTDVFAGAVLGIACGAAAVLICRAVYKKYSDKLTNMR